MSKNENALERAIINMLYARAELVSLTDPQALCRAIDLINNALDELISKEERFGAFRGPLAA